MYAFLRKMKIHLFSLHFFVIFMSLVVNNYSYPMIYGKDLRENAMSSKETVDPTEIQNAMCNVVTDQIRATANATITRQLKGVCHAKDVREQLRHIETKMMREIHKVHRTLQAIVSQNNQKPVIFKYLPNRP